jgi:hypothetical protein
MTDVIPPSPPIPLNYAPAPPRWRRPVWRFALLMMVLAVGFCGWRWRAYAWDQAQVLYWQHRCMTFTAPPDMVVYEEEPTAAAVLLNRPDYFSRRLRRPSGTNGSPATSIAASFTPLCWNRLQTLNPIPMTHVLDKSIGQPTAFLHERISPAGHHRLVCVNYTPMSASFPPMMAQFEGFEFYATALTPATFTTFSTPASTSYYSRCAPSAYPNKSPRVRVYAGQPDPNNPAHFTIRYQMLGQDDVLDGNLKDDDSITFMPRNPPQWPGNE